MPASHEQLPNKSLSGSELRTIIMRDVEDILAKDGMFNGQIAFGRVSYEVRVSLHLDNPIYPLHVATVLSRPASKQQIAETPELAAIELSPLVSPSDDETVIAEEVQRQIASPNMARVSNDLPLTIQRRDPSTGQMVEVSQKFKGDFPDPAEVGNVSTTRNVSSEQRERWGRKKGGK